MGQILVVAEKPSVAMTISKVLGATNKKDGYTIGNGYIVSWCVGHLVGLSPPETYGEKYAVKPWKVENLPIIPVDWKFSINKNTKNQFDVLKKLMNDENVLEIVCATDAGREGECIFRYVYNAAKCKKPFKRLWISSLEESAIKNGFQNLRNGNEFDKLYDSGLCRAKADWLVGMNGTRLFSAVYHSFLSVGRVQTPTLAMIGERDYKVRNFIKEKYFNICLDCGDFIAISEKINDLNFADQIKSSCTDNTATVTSVKKATKSEKPPKLFDLTSLQQEANCIFAYTAQETLDYTQSLYEKKLATYPRTDSKYITEDMMDTTFLIAEKIYRKLDIEKFNIEIKLIANNKLVSDHHAILPTNAALNSDLSGLKEGEENILYLLMLRLLCAVEKNYVYETLSANIECGGYNFTTSGKSDIACGWKEINNFVGISFGIKNIKDDTEDIAEDKKSLDIFEGQKFEKTNCRIAEKWTSPPKHYTEATLLSAMETAGNKDYESNSDIEKKGLGTPATRAAIIETLISRGYIERKKKNLIATDKGSDLIKILPVSIKSAHLTAEWETVLQRIANGETNANSFMDSIEAFTKMLVVNNSSAISENKNLFARENESVIIGKCPKCGGNITETPKAYSCGGGRGECKFLIWKTISSKAISLSQVKKLLSKGKTDKIKGFKNKAGKEFEASLIIKKDSTIGFEF